MRSLSNCRLVRRVAATQLLKEASIVQPQRMAAGNAYASQVMQAGSRSRIGRWFELSDDEHIAIVVRGTVRIRQLQFVNAVIARGLVQTVINNGTIDRSQASRIGFPSNALGTWGS